MTNSNEGSIEELRPPSTPYENERKAFQDIAQAMQFYKPHEFLFSFNGGKDCTVLLHLLAKFYKNTPLQHLRIPVLYVQCPFSFPEVDQFVLDVVRDYDVDLIIRQGPIKEALFEVCAAMPHIKAVFIGSRRTDPFCADMKGMQPTDPDWPPLMRVSPLLDWSYHEIWDYIFEYKVPYCELYNRGYTSLGNTTNTIPNPHLKVTDQNGCSVVTNYLPAYELQDETKERSGRFSAASC